MAESIPNLLKFSKDDLSTVCEYIDRQNTTPIISNYFDKIINFVIDDKERDEIGHALDEYLMNLASDVDPEEVSLKQERDYSLLFWLFSWRYIFWLDYWSAETDSESVSLCSSANS